MGHKDKNKPKSLNTFYHVLIKSLSHVDNRQMVQFTKSTGGSGKISDFIIWLWFKGPGIVRAGSLEKQRSHRVRYQ